MLCIQTHQLFFQDAFSLRVIDKMSLLDSMHTLEASIRYIRGPVEVVWLRIFF